MLKNSANYTLLLHIVQDNFLTQLVDTPAREASILDLVLVSNPDIVDNLIVGEPFSDRNAVTFSIQCRPYERRKSNKVTYFYSEADWAYLRELLNYIPWHCVFLEDGMRLTYCSAILFCSCPSSLLGSFPGSGICKMDAPFIFCALEALLCSKFCRQNVERPRHHI